MNKVRTQSLSRLNPFSIILTQSLYIYDQNAPGSNSKKSNNVSHIYNPITFIHLMFNIQRIKTIPNMTPNPNIILQMPITGPNRHNKKLIKLPHTFLLRTVKKELPPFPIIKKPRRIYEKEIEYMEAINMHDNPTSNQIAPAPKFIEEKRNSQNALTT